MKKQLLITLTLGLSLIVIGSLSACNTVKGFGEDMESAGRSISGAF